MKRTFTFKKNSSSVWSLDESVTIKHKRKSCGTIWFKRSKNIAIVKFQIIKDGKKFDDGNPNCSWMWVELAHKTHTIEEMKAWLKDNAEKILDTYNLHFHEND